MPRLQCKCGRYLKADAKKCPKCGRKVTDKMVIADLAPIAVSDKDVKTLNARKLHWVPPAKAHENICARYADLRDRVRSGHGYFEPTMNALRSMAKTKREGCWTTEAGTKGQMVVVSPKGNRYVRAKESEKAQLILDYGARDAKGWVLNAGKPQLIRLRRYDPAKTTRAERSEAKLVKRHHKKVRVMKRAKKHALKRRSA